MRNDDDRDFRLTFRVCEIVSDCVIYRVHRQNRKVLLKLFIDVYTLHVYRAGLYIRTALFIIVEFSNCAVFFSKF